MNQALATLAVLAALLAADAAAQDWESSSAVLRCSPPARS
jgi:hypothetical protein